MSDFIEKREKPNTKPPESRNINNCAECEKEKDDCINCETQINSGGVYQRRWKMLENFLLDQANKKNQIASCALFAMKQIEKNIN